MKFKKNGSKPSFYFEMGSRNSEAQLQQVPNPRKYNKR